MLTEKQNAALALGRLPSAKRDASLALGRGGARDYGTNRAAMLAEGRKRYQGHPCPHGHTGERFVSTRGCVVCTMTKSAASKKANPIRGRELARAWAAANPERIKKRRRDSPAIYYAIKVKHRAAKIARTCGWADDKQIAAYYKIAANLTRAVGRKYEVDHILPLQGKLVSGLHVQNNLQILLKEDNCRKHNSFEGGLSAA